MSANPYTASIASVVVDLSLFITAFQGTQPTLASFPTLTRQRWEWLADRWSTGYRKRFLQVAEGSEALLKLVSDLDYAVTSYKIGVKNSNPLKTDSGFLAYLDFLDTVSLQELTLTQQESLYVQSELERALSLSLTDFELMRAALDSDARFTAESVGLGDDDAAKALGTVKAPRQRSYKIEDLEQISTTLDLVSFLDGVIFDYRSQQSPDPNLTAAANQNVLPASGISFDATYTTAIAVPFQESLEAMARRYLGSSDAWFEIVQTNKLQPPYVDIYGEKVSILSPPVATTVRVTIAVATKLPVGTRVRIGSDLVRESMRFVDKVVDNGDNTLSVYLSGQPFTDLRVQDKPYLRVYTPGTVTEDSLILVPSRLIAPATPQMPSSDRLSRLSKVLLAFGVDVKRDGRSGDIVLDGSGNFQYVAGLDNIRQTVLYILKTKQGELEDHPDYGISLEIGGRFQGLTDDALVLAEIVREAVLADRRFSFCAITNISVTPISASINLLVNLPGSNDVIPLGFASAT